MLDKLNQVYAKVIAESIENKRSRINKNVKKTGRSLVSESTELNLTFNKNEDGSIICTATCDGKAIAGTGKDVKEALSDFVEQFDGCNSLVVEDPDELNPEPPADDFNDTDEGCKDCGPVPGPETDEADTTCSPYRSKRNCGGTECCDGRSPRKPCKKF